MKAEDFTHWVRVAILSKLLILKEIQAILRVELTDSGYRPHAFAHIKICDKPGHLTATMC
jgi:hypothetical protein